MATTTTTTVIQDALERAAAAHGVYEAEVLGGQHHDEWPEWYAQHMARTLTEDGYQLVHNRKPITTSKTTSLGNVTQHAKEQ